MAKTVWIDKEECIGCELCVNSCPGVFRMNEEVKAEVFDPKGESEENIQQAIDACPVSCIHWTED